ncbi:small basic protein [Haloferula luteola]|uniref:Small basic protein n=1 Tax=Haloferula luteola TaxID=595692 RepID=A0A840V377_9BACT|nr:small basic protein [Haloferula luteola]
MKRGFAFVSCVALAVGLVVGVLWLSEAFRKLLPFEILPDFFVNWLHAIPGIEPYNTIPILLLLVALPIVGVRLFTDEEDLWRQFMRSLTTLSVLMLTGLPDWDWVRWVAVGMLVSCLVMANLLGRILERRRHQRFEHELSVLAEENRLRRETLEREFGPREV